MNEVVYIPKSRVSEKTPARAFTSVSTAIKWFETPLWAEACCSNIV